MNRFSPFGNGENLLYDPAWILSNLGVNRRVSGTDVNLTQWVKSENIWRSLSWDERQDANQEYDHAKENKLSDHVFRRNDPQHGAGL
jgi:hypothetical protein